MAWQLRAMHGLPAMVSRGGNPVRPLDAEAQALPSPGRKSERFVHRIGQKLTADNTARHSRNQKDLLTEGRKEKSLTTDGHGWTGFTGLGSSKTNKYLNPWPSFGRRTGLFPPEADLPKA